MCVCAEGLKSNAPFTCLKWVRVKSATVQCSFFEVNKESKTLKIKRSTITTNSNIPKTVICFFALFNFIQHLNIYFNCMRRSTSTSSTSAPVYVSLHASVCTIWNVREHMFMHARRLELVCVRARARVCVCLGGPFGLVKTSAPSYVRGLVWHLGNILYPALQHYTQFTAKGHYVPVNPLLIDISANSTTSQPHDRSLPPQNQKIAVWRLKIER